MKQKPANKSDPPVETPDHDTSQSLTPENIREEMRNKMTQELYSLLPKFFATLNAMKKDEKFVRTMLQVFKYTLPPYKSLEMKERPRESFSEEFLREFGMELI